MNSTVTSTTLPSSVQELCSDLGRWEIPFFLRRNSRLTTKGCKAARDVRRQRIPVEAALSQMREVRSVVFKVSHPDLADFSEHIYVCASYRSHQKLSSSALEKAISSTLRVSRNGLKVKLAAESDLEQFGAAPGKIHPFLTWPIHLYDGDLLRRYYFGEHLVTNAGHRLWSLQFSAREALSKACQIPEVLSASIPDFPLVKKRSASLRKTERLINQRTVIVGYDQISISAFQRKLTQEIRLRLSKLKEQDHLSENDLSIPYSGLFTAERRSYSFRTSSSGLLSYSPAAGEEVVGELENFLSGIPRGAQVMIPCNIIPALPGLGEAVRQHHHISIFDAVEQAIRKKTHADDQILILGGSLVSDSQSSIYARLRSDPKLRHRLLWLDPEQGHQLDVAMLMFQAGELEVAREHLQNVVEYFGDRPLKILLASTSLCLLFENERGHLGEAGEAHSPQMSSETFLGHDGQEVLNVLDIYSEYCSESLLGHRS